MLAYTVDILHNHTTHMQQLEPRLTTVMFVPIRVHKISVSTLCKQHVCNLCLFPTYGVMQRGIALQLHV